MVYVENGEVFKGVRSAPEGGRITANLGSFVSRISSDPNSEFPAEAGRYHLVVSYACPYAHRALIVRALKGLDSVISLGVAYPGINPEEDLGWRFVTSEEAEEFPECHPDTVLGAKHLHEYYVAADSKYSGKVTVPVLWDKKKKTIVNNESADIIEMLNSEFASLVEGVSTDFYPGDLRKEIDGMSELAYKINVGVYKCGFATSQDAYEAACKEVFATLDRFEAVLQDSRYLVDTTKSGAPPSKGGPGWRTAEPTLADWRLFPSLIRFDAVYYGLFKCNLRHLRDYPNLQAYMTDLYTIPGVAATVRFDHIKAAYYRGLRELNPKGVVPRGDVPFTPAVPQPRRWLGLPEAQEATHGSHAEDHAGHGKDDSHRLKGEFVRPTSGFRKWITADGSSGFKAEAGRYHLYLANNCPWCHRVHLTWAILGLQSVISRDVVWYRRDPENGWQFNPGEPGCTPDTANGGIKFIVDLYKRVGSKERSVPILWDKQTGAIISNESADIIRMLAQGFAALAAPGAPDLAPDGLLADIDAINKWVYEDVNNGAYKASFATTQPAYDAAFANFFAALDRLELRLSTRKWLFGDAPTEADVRLFPTIFRFDHVYFVRFQLNKAMIVELYPHLQRWMLDFYELPGVKEASNIDHCKKGYFGRSGNNIVPLGPQLSYHFDQ